eukprot:s710_g16.t1
MVKSSSPSLTDAVAAVGVMNSQVGVNLEIATSELTSRSKAAVVQRQQQAGITVRTTAQMCLVEWTQQRLSAHFLCSWRSSCCCGELIHADSGHKVPILVWITGSLERSPVTRLPS